MVRNAVIAAVHVSHTGRRRFYVQTNPNSSYPRD